ncbi:MAG: hypothetical protein QM767_12450 [Anaeromyxobacter sp.]
MPLAPGSPAPDAVVEDAQARAPVALGGLWASGPALLFVYKADCAASELAAAALPHLAALPGLTVAALAQEDAATAAAFGAAHGWPGRVKALLDAEPWTASDRLQVLVTPTWLLLERGGRVAKVCEGWSRADAEALAAQAAELCGAPPPALPEGGAGFRPG